MRIARSSRGSSLNGRNFDFSPKSDQRRLMIALQNMRMSCNSTYLLDQTSDHGNKADELATLLEEQFERPETKVVIFSQWLRTHELIERRLKPRGFRHVLFHGGMPGPARKGLIDRFREDEGCRAFLSTDAGGVGLNLQHASVVVNMDLPWNPAVLEQRIGRVHRLGQSRPVQVINFVSQGTIEEGMLSLLSFKKSLFTGALDGGEKEVFLGGSRLTRFMETVDKASSNIPAAPPEEPVAATETAATENDGDIPDHQTASADAAHAAGTTDPWSGLIQTGLTFLQQLAAGTSSSSLSTAARGSTAIRRDKETGEPYLHLPVPKPETISRILASAEQFMCGLAELTK